MAEYDYDMIVVGSGPAGQRAAIQAAKLEKHVAVLERRAVVGGVCLNTGTIPSKTLREAVMHLSGYRERGVYGASYAVKEHITVAERSTTSSIPFSISRHWRSVTRPPRSMASTVLVDHGFVLEMEQEMNEKKYSKPAERELKQKLSDLQYQVTQHEGTEPPFNNEYWNNKRPGIYVDVVTGEPLFSSLDKYDSGTGWPSFTKPLEPDNIVTHTDRKLWMPRTEARSKHGDSHLGHIFDDGPEPTGLRYCMNSASLRFIPVERLEEEGYGEYLSLFEEQKGEKAKGEEPGD